MDKREEALLDMMLEDKKAWQRCPWWKFQRYRYI